MTTHNITLRQKTTFPQMCGRLLLRLLGWQAVENIPDTPKYLIIAAHHTSNWDVPIGLLYALASGIHFKWVAKDDIFFWPIAGIWKKLGGIPVNRRSRNNFVDQMIEKYQEHDELVIVITPEGTRSKTKYWKTGFYYIALGANVPIALGFLDFKRKILGVDGSLIPTGDLEADLVPIRKFYADKMGKFPHEHGIIEIRPGKSDPKKKIHTQ